MMDGLPTREGQYCTAPMCLLYVNANKQLVPIAIQLKQEEDEDNQIFLPSDNLVDWMLAKIFYQSAHAQVGLIIFMKLILCWLKLRLLHHNFLPDVSTHPVNPLSVIINTLYILRLQLAR